MTDPGEPDAQAILVRAPGKINLGLAVGPPGYDGYHPLRTVFQAVELFEDVRVRPAEQLSVSFTGPIDTGALLGDTLVHRAARVLATSFGLAPNADISVLKRVPIAGGMGGGSADAAATLVACNEAWKLDADLDELHTIAASLGADVPFALYGGTRLGTGRGDQLIDVLTQSRYTWVLVPDSEGLSTPKVYAELDRMRASGEASTTQLDTDPRIDTLLSALRDGDPELLAAALFNDLDAAACSLRPELELTRLVGIEAGALAALLSGSGPTMMLLAHDNQHALEIQLAMRASGIDTLVTHGPARGALFASATATG